MQKILSSGKSSDELNRRRYEFLSSWSPEACWVCGVTHGNGHVSDSGRVMFCSPEKTTVDKWRSWMFVEREPTFARGVWMSHFDSVLVAGLFRKNGMGPRKREKLCVPTRLPKSRRWHYLRGLLEMDGAFFWDDPRKGESTRRGRKKFLLGFGSANESFCKEVYELLGAKTKITRSTKEWLGKTYEGWSFRLAFGQSVSVLREMYKNASSDMWCERRRGVAQEAIDLWDKYQQPCEDCKSKPRVTETRCLKCHHEFMFGDRPKVKCSWSDGCDRDASIGCFCTRHYHRQNRKKKRLASGGEYKHRNEYREDAFGDLLRSLAWSNESSVSIDLSWNDDIHIRVDIDGHEVLMDRGDVKLLGDWTWRVNRGGYLARKSMGIAVRFHRIVAGTPDGMETDHINGNKLDNRRCNLRVVTTQQNQFNRGTSSGRKGVKYYSRINRWSAQIFHDGSLYSLGYFDTQEQAQAAYDEAALKLWGAFARPVNAKQNVNRVVMATCSVKPKKARTDKMDRGVCSQCHNVQATATWKSVGSDDRQVCQRCFARLYREKKAKEEGREIRFHRSPVSPSDVCRWSHGDGCSEKPSKGCRGFCFTHGRADDKLQRGEELVDVLSWIESNRNKGRPRSNNS